MEELFLALGLSIDEATRLIVIGVALVVILLAARALFRLTASIMRLGCAAIIVLITALFVLTLVA